MSVAGTIRFIIGAALVAAGTTLAAPLAVKLAAAARMPVQVPPGVDPAAWEPPAAAAAEPAAPSPPATAPSAAWQADAGSVPVGDPWASSAPDGGGLQLDRCPPPPPAPLPAAPQQLAQASPVLGGAYRSTLDVPPPPLLDTEKPPPVVAWPSAPVSSRQSVPGPAMPQTVAAAELTVPSTYRIQDGDDLGTIAGRFYGQPAAAAAIWAANRETIPNPDLLPIGVELRLPPSWAVRGRRQPVAGAIEPAAYARPPAPPANPAGAAASLESGSWLTPGHEPPAPPAVPPVETSPLAHRAVAASSVRVGPGETLGTLAMRLYGDPAMAAQLFAVNRDRLRSPDLVVPGMELRLPRPVTAAVP